MHNESSRNLHRFAFDEDMCSISTNSPGLWISSDSGDEIVVERPHPDPIDLRFRVGAHRESNDSFRQRRCD